MCLSRNNISLVSYLTHRVGCMFLLQVAGVVPAKAKDIMMLLLRQLERACHLRVPLLLRLLMLLLI